MIIFMAGVSFVAISLLIKWLAANNIYMARGFNSILELLNYHRMVRAYGNLKFFSNVNISSIGMAIAFAPVGFLYAIFAPFPWQLGSAMQIMAVPETIVFYILFPFTVKGIIMGYKKKFAQTALFLSIIVATLGFLGLVEGNAGTIFRHRAIAFYLLFIFTAVGITAKNES